MIQIVLLLLCVYLIFKGKELTLLAAALPPESREKAQSNAGLWFFASIILALLFAFWAIQQGSSISRPGL